MPALFTGLWASFKVTSYQPPEGDSNPLLKAPTQSTGPPRLGSSRTLHMPRSVHTEAGPSFLGLHSPDPA